MVLVRDIKLITFTIGKIWKFGRVRAINEVACSVIGVTGFIVVGSVLGSSLRLVFVSVLFFMFVMIKSNISNIVSEGRDNYILFSKYIK